MPTETVYGLAADAANAQAVARLYAAKGRPSFNPLITHVARIEDAFAHGQFSDKAQLIARHFWPGPLTIVVPRRAGSAVTDLACAGLETIALRVPSHEVTRALIEAAERPLVAPSANRSGHVSPTLPSHVADDFGETIDLILDAGASIWGLESTVIAFDEADTAYLLRAGALSRSALENIVGPLHAPYAHAAPHSPGMLERHYAPRARLRLNATRADESEVLLGFGDAAGARMNLSPDADITEAAAHLYQMLRALDAEGHAAIAVSPIPNEGLGEAINDRLRRAALGRS